MSYKDMANESRNQAFQNILFIHILNLLYVIDKHTEDIKKYLNRLF